ncbi:unnamed protein product [Schistocephalus solidus]|uniref:Secreted protein n=1 Tax=Schistocephalus solidus TaxID=70667 RepID=A0A183SCU5_SCHSO|nr:unnamed protein product [Schistocephalus solidus]
MFILWIAEALIANQEANRMSDNTGLEKTPTSVRTPPLFSDLHGEREAPSYRHDLPLKVRKRADSIDGHILRSAHSSRATTSVTVAAADIGPIPVILLLLLPIVTESANTEKFIRLCFCTQNGRLRILIEAHLTFAPMAATATTIIPSCPRR